MGGSVDTEAAQKLLRWLAFLLLWILISFLAQGQRSRCADCHSANLNAPNRRHLEDWERSAHGRSGVGRELCHGGDSSTFEPFLAHRGVLNSRNPASPTHWRNPPQTCGSCHPEPYRAFQESHHHDMLAQGHDGVPGCASCHGNVAAQLLTPRGLYSQCSSCHGEGRSASRPEYPSRSEVVSRTGQRRSFRAGPLPDSDRASARCGPQSSASAGIDSGAGAVDASRRRWASLRL
jgi:hypothetical protein